MSQSYLKKTNENSVLAVLSNQIVASFLKLEYIVQEKCVFRGSCGGFALTSIMKPKLDYLTPPFL